VGARVLVVDDDPQLRQALTRALELDGYSITTAGNGVKALELVSQDRPDVMVLDVMMPYVGGLDVCRTLRGRKDRLPILVLTARDEVGDRVAGLDAGADDYLTKPFNMDELLARVRAVSRRAYRTHDIAQARIGEHTVDLALRLVTGPHGGVTLTPIEWEILEVLIRNTGRLVSQAQLLTEVGGSAYVKENRSLRVHMAHLRRKLESNPARPRHLQNEPGMGYRFSA
jgi:two-component system KDP operon response regulator KdpE